VIFSPESKNPYVTSPSRQEFFLPPKNQFFPFLGFYFFSAPLYRNYPQFLCIYMYLLISEVARVFRSASSLFSRSCVANEKWAFQPALLGACVSLKMTEVARVLGFPTSFSQKTKFQEKTK